MRQSVRICAGLALLALTVAGPVRGQTLTASVASGPVSLDPHASLAPGHVESLKHIYDTLLWIGDTLQLEARLAEGWRPIDATTWEFKLRSGVKFHDGSDFSAEDVKVSIERLPAISGLPAEQTPVRAIRQVRITGPLSLDIITHAPAPMLPNDLSRLLIVSSKALAAQEAATVRAAFDSGRAAVGAGPYRYAGWAAGERLVLERHDGYWRGPEPFAQHIRLFQADEGRRLDDVASGRADVAALASPDRVPEARTLGNIALSAADSQRLFALDLDVRESAAGLTRKDGTPLPANPLRTAKVRIALDLAIDRQGLVDTILHGQGKPLNQMALRQVTGFNRTLPPRVHNTAAARKLLAEAGFADGFSLTLLAVEGRSATETALADAVAAMLGAAGLDVKLTRVPETEFLLRRAGFSLSLAPWMLEGGEVFPLLAAAAHRPMPDGRLGAANVLGYRNDRIDLLLDAAAVETSDGKRRSALEEATALYARDYQRLPLVAAGAVWAVRKDRIKWTPRADGETLATSARPDK